MQFYYKNKQFLSITRVLIFTLLLLGVSSFSVHKYYTSITKIEVDQKEQLLKMYTHVFVDDFEKLLQERYQLEIADFSKVSNTQKKQIENYLNKKIKLAVNRKPLTIKFLGCQLENQLLYLYYEASLSQKVERLDIENTLLMDLFVDQQNTVDVTFDTEVKSVHLTQQNIKKTIFF